ncbi:MFS transporter [Streptantibioticus cattleyicolor]|uniref:Major facilitator superfamily multidrug resistance protein n=1 Tax=Streptantibioticus cattleyicolor (strain ATCC 35852 / DSM 46488 / JCM 4925 / NBRC 14057 / NRRL 8057) TaxID=1003195 RepID=F8JLL4_STREN|nr:MFS transporter [Streptantibioticus cattleyicolor]AEW98257.1 major facilitator superfamily multidrug resistance protein [Streptantibioticus cattleyicolor NRRL 8057 = DSM 46488]CCB72680.1 putative multidrug resistance transporter, MFS superfamily [Streptantibioticus cattleyicolor NRRL 8057 = DSM 46488]
MVTAGYPAHRPARRHTHRALAVGAVAFVYTVVMAGGTLTIPLYVLWAARFGFGPLTTVVVFVAYVVGVVGTLLVAGSLSDAIGRRPVLALSLALTALSAVGFALADGLAVLLVSRVLSGVATGLITATATSAIAELVRGRRTAAVLGTAANVGGLSLGVVAAGVLAQCVTAPTHTVFWCYLGMCAVAGVCWLVIPETADRTAAWRPRIRRPVLPDGSSRVRSFVASGVLVAASSGVNGFFSSLAPAFLRDDLGVSNFAVIGVGVGALFVSALLAQIVMPAALLRRDIGTALLAVGMIVIEAALWTRSAPLFVVGTVFAGAAVGTLLRHGLSVTDALCGPGNRAELNATYFLFLYSGLVVPVLLLGFADQAVGTRVSSAMLAAVVVSTALVGLALGRRTGPTSTPDTVSRPSTHLTPVEENHE